jgi:hypothetical protein
MPRFCQPRQTTRCNAMPIYRLRMIDRHGQLIAVHYLSFDSDAKAIRHADTAVGEYDCERVEAWAGDNLICAVMRRVG